MITGLFVALYIFTGIATAVIAVKVAGPPPEPIYNTYLIFLWPIALAGVICHYVGRCVTKLAGGCNEDP